MHNPGTVVFHKLINRNRPNRHSDTACITEQTTNHYTTEDQTKCFARYYGDLTVPKDKGYDTASLEHRNVRHTLMEDICEEEAKTYTQVITSEMIQKAVESLNTGKAADEHGLKAEHLQNSPYSVHIFLEMCFKRILNDKITPDIFKIGILTPVLKKAKNPMIMDNYRGITVTPTVSKIFETTILPLLKQDFNQSSLQFGFTEGLSMLMAALIITEGRAEAKTITLDPLILITLDSQEAFDVVDHIILPDKLYESIPNRALWMIVQNLYKGLTSKIKWKGSISNSFEIEQGLRQRVTAR
jgi:hypothetical protein